MSSPIQDHQRLCPICYSKVGGAEVLFCENHQVAFENIKRSFEEWSSAYGSLPKNRYLQMLRENAYSGSWVVEVAEYLVREGKAEILL